MVARLVNWATVTDGTWASPSLVVPTAGARRGDLIIVYSWALDLAATTTTAPALPAFLDEDIVTDVYVNGSYVVRAGFVADLNMSSMTLTRGSGQGNGAWNAHVWVVRGVSRDAGWLEDVEVLVPGEPTSAITFGEQIAAGDDRLALRITSGFVVTEAPDVPGDSALSDTSYTLRPMRAAFPGGYTWADAASKVTDGTAGELTIDTPVPEGPVAVSGVALLLVSAPSAKTLPAQPAPQRLALTCAQDYGVWITDATYVNTLKRVEWNNLAWERVLDDISAASASIPDTPTNRRCLTDLGGLVPWEYGLAIERDSEIVWTGPITSIMRESGQLRVAARDTLARFQKLPVIWGEPVEYESVDAAKILTDIVNVHSFSAANPWRLRAPDFNVDAPLTRELRASQEEAAWSVIAEILDAAVDAFVIGNTLYCWDIDSGWVYWNGRRTAVLDGPYNASRDLVYGTFTRETFKEAPQWSISGGDQVNYFVAVPADVGEAGFRERYLAEDVSSQARAGILYASDPNPLHVPTGLNSAERDAIFQRRADGYVALHRRAPAILSGQALAIGAPIDVPNLLPGSIWVVDIEDFGFTQGTQATRLKRVSVEVAKEESGGIIENVTPTIYPIGYETQTGGGDA